MGIESDQPVEPHDRIPAGAFSAWLAAIGRAVSGDEESAVPCGTCTACCRSSQFIHIAPDETAALARIPSRLLVAAPGLPRGNVLMGYDRDGRCPMLIEDACSIYEDRPRTCRTYDCRIFPAAGIEPEPDQQLIADRTKQWEFDHPDESDRIEHAAVRAAAVFVTTRSELFGDGPAPATATQRAALALEVVDAFLGRDASGEPVVVEPSVAEVRVVLDRRQR